MTGSVAGIVLAGGRSSRMGTSKALLVYHGQPLYVHMMGVLRAAGLDHVYISGDVLDIDCVPDMHPHEGPARAIADLQEKFSGQYTRLLIVPVDMPLLTSAVLRTLLDQPGSSHLQGHPFPLCLEVRRIDARVTSMYGLIAASRVTVLPCPTIYERLMHNANTPAEWQILQA